MMIKLKIIMLSVLRIPSVNNTELLIMNELQDDEYRHMLQMLNKEQKEFFYHVLHLIKSVILHEQQINCILYSIVFIL